MKSLDRRIATAGPLLFKLGKFWRRTLGGKQGKSEITKFDLKKKEGRFRSICHNETGNEIHFPLDLTCTMGIICFPLVYDLSDTDLVQS